jgi:hypothetical protein
MSTFSQATLRCRCGFEHAVEVADSVHAARRPDLRAAILAGEFHCFACPACGRVAHVEKLFAYTDFPRRQWFTVAPAASLARRSEWLAFAERTFHAVFVERAAPIATEWAPEFTRRVIFGLASLREKLLAFDVGLDDRRVEQLKVALVNAGRLIYVAGGYCHLVAVTAGELVFEWAVPEDVATTRAIVARSEYDALLDNARDDAPLASALFTTPVVDMRVLFVAEAAGGAP